MSENEVEVDFSTVRIGDLRAMTPEQRAEYYRWYNAQTDDSPAPQ